jgi:hypothetical protein
VKPPRVVKVGPYQYTVNAFDSLAELTSQSAGVNFNKTEVHYDPAQSPGQMRDSILHELLHCIIYETHIRKEIGSEEDEEKLVWTLSPRILALLRDNPRLVQYLTETE